MRENEMLKELLLKDVQKEAKNKENYAWKANFSWLIYAPTIKAFKWSHAAINTYIFRKMMKNQAVFIRILAFNAIIIRFDRQNKYQKKSEFMTSAFGV